MNAARLALYLLAVAGMFSGLALTVAALLEPNYIDAALYGAATA